MDILSAYVDFAKGSTDAPTKFHQYCAPALVGSVLGRRVWLQHGHRRLFPHTWICLIGPSGVKKTTSLGIAEDILAQVSPESMLPAKFSYEKLFMEIARNPSGTLVYGELHSFLTLLGRDYNAEAKSGLADMWDSPALRGYATKGAGDKIVMEYPALSILAGTTLSWFIEVARSRDIAGGFFARMLFTVVEQSDVPVMILPPPRDQGKAEEIKKALKVFRERFPQEMQPGGQMRLHPEAKAEYERAFHSLNDTYKRSEILAPFATRGQVYILKLAMIAAMGRRGAMEITAEDVAYGYSLVRDAIKGIAEIVQYEVAEDRTDGHLKKLRKMILAAGPKGMPYREILRVGPVRQTDQCRKLLKTLLETEEILSITGKKGGEGYVWAGAFPQASQEAKP